MNTSVGTPSGLNRSVPDQKGCPRRDTSTELGHYQTFLLRPGGLRGRPPFLIFGLLLVRIFSLSPAWLNSPDISIALNALLHSNQP